MSRNTVVEVLVGLVALVGAAFGVVAYFDSRYQLKSDDYIPVMAQLPAGVILPWYTKSGSVPKGWAICDGSNGTPDLRQKVIMGVGGFTDVGVSGGNNTFVIPSQKIMSYAKGWDNIITESPNGGPMVGQGWGSKQWHRLVSEGEVGSVSLDLRPAFVSALFIMKLPDSVGSGSH